VSFIVACSGCPSCAFSSAVRKSFKSIAHRYPTQTWSRCDPVKGMEPGQEPLHSFAGTLADGILRKVNHTLEPSMLASPGLCFQRETRRGQKRSHVRTLHREGSPSDFLRTL